MLESVCFFGARVPFGVKRLGLGSGIQGASVFKYLWTTFDLG